MKIKDLINKIGLFTIPLMGGWAGAFGGADKTSKSWRRILIPGLLTSYAYSNTESVLVITIMSMSFALSIGYGIPGIGDNGSALGKFYYTLFKQNHSLADMFTRGTIGLIIGLSLVSIPIIKHNWLIYGLGSLGIILINALISWRNFGSYILFKKELSWVETINWGLITLLGTIIIYF
jgi:hypothetical protein